MEEDNELIEEIQDIAEETVKKEIGNIPPVVFPDVQKVEVTNFLEKEIKIEIPEIKVPEPKVTVNVKPPEVTVKPADVIIPEPIDNSAVLRDILEAVSENKPIPFDVSTLSEEMKKVVEAVRNIRITGHGGVSSKRVILNIDGKAINPSTIESTTHQKTAFGELSVAELSPVVQVQFPYNINTDMWEIRNNGGTSSVENNMAKLSTGAGANQSSIILTKIPIKYNPGQGAVVKGTPLFTIGVANSIQYWGTGNSTDGYFFGYEGATFGILRKQGGKPETRRLTIDTKSSDADSITITLDGDTKAVTVTNGADATVTANEIAATDFSNVGEGWEIHAMGDKVFFTSFTDGAKSGTYSLTDATSAVGTFAQSLAGVTSTNNITPQSLWSEDTCDGSGDANNPSGINCDFTKGNVFQIRYQWLGFGLISFFIENPEDGGFFIVHKIKYANANIIPSVDNPTLPLCMMVKNTSNTSDIVMKIGSMAGFVEGRDTLSGLPNSFDVESANIGTTETPVMTIHAHDIYQGTLNRVKIKMTTCTISIEGTKPATIRIRKNATLVGGSFSALNSNTSTIHTDTSATSVSDGTIVWASGIEKIGSVTVDLEKLGVTLVAPEFLTVSLEASAGTLDSVSTLNWQELF